MKRIKIKKAVRRRRILYAFLILAEELIILGAYRLSSFFNAAQGTVTQIVNIIPLEGDSFLFFFQALLLFCSILFGFYAIVLIQIVPTLRKLFENHMKKTFLLVKIVIWISLFLLMAAPPYYLFEAITNSLTGTGSYGYISAAMLNGTVTSNSIVDFHSIATTSVRYAYSAGQWIFVVLAIYAILAGGMAEWILKRGIMKYLNQLANELADIALPKRCFKKL